MAGGELELTTCPPLPQLGEAADTYSGHLLRGFSRWPHSTPAGRERGKTAALAKGWHRQRWHRQRLHRQRRHLQRAHLLWRPRSINPEVEQAAFFEANRSKFGSGLRISTIGIGLRKIDVPTILPGFQVALHGDAPNSRALLFDVEGEYPI
jgi:hypothetical protein